MNYKKIFLISLSILIILSFSSTVMAEENITEGGNTIIVDGSSTNQMVEPTIQTAINNASARDTIEITGINYEHCHFIVDKPLNIISNVGTKMSTCPSNIKGSDGIGIFYFNENATGSVLSGFTFSNDAAKLGSVNPYALYINGASNIEIMNCKITEVSDGPGIYIVNGSDININQNTIRKSQKGIFITDSGNINITHSIIERNKEAGIYIGENVENTNIYNNTIYLNNWKGIYYASCVNSNITSNNISDNRNENVQSKATEGTGIYVDSSMEFLRIRGNYIKENGNYGIFNSYLTTSSIDKIKTYDDIEKIEEIDENIFIRHLTRGMYTQQSADGGTYLVYVKSNFYAHEQFCPSTYYEPGVLRKNNDRDLVFSAIQEAEPGIYNISFMKKNTGEIAEYLTTTDVTFFLNKESTKASIEKNDQAKIIRVVNGTATVDFTDCKYKSKSNTITAMSVGFGPIDVEVTTDRLSAIYNVPDANIPNGTVQVETQLIGNNLTKYYGNETPYTVTLVNGYGNYISGQNITLNLNGHDYTRITDENGAAKINIDLNPGTYSVTAIFTGTDEYPPSNTSNIITIISTIESSNLTKIFRNATPFIASFTNSEGKPLKNQNVIFTINENKYNKQTDDNGTAKININLVAGTYTIISENTATGEVTSNTIIVLSKITNNKDITKYFKNDTQFYVTLLDDTGNPVNNGSVKFNINGVFYTREINKDGVAKLNINLNPGEYIITTEYDGCLASNNITVLSKISNNNDITKYFKNDTQFYVTLLDDTGNPVNNGSVKFNINGVFYTREINKDGVAKLNINLNPGEYIITTEYNGCLASNTVKVLPLLIADDLVKEYGITEQFKVKLVDGEGKSVSGEDITFNVNGVFYRRTTDINGIGALNINLGVGKYIITSSNKDSIISNTIEVLETITIAPNLSNNEIQSILDSTTKKVAAKFEGSTYSDISLNINKPILLNGNNAVLNGKLKNSVITVNCDDVIVKNTKINAHNGSGIAINNVKNSIVQNNVINNTASRNKINYHNSSEVLLEGNGVDISGQKTKLDGNTITKFKNGINLKNADNTIIKENTITKNNFGIEFDKNVKNTEISDNNISNQIGWYTMDMVEGPYGYGISVRHSGTNINIKDNQINENYMGIFLDSENSSGIKITGNEIRDSIIEGFTANENYTPASGATLIVENNALYNNAKGPSLMILGEVSANPAGIYGPGEWDDDLKLELGPNWYGTTLYTKWGDNNTGPGTICPRIKTTLIDIELTNSGEGKYNVAFVKDNKTVTELPDFKYHFTLNAYTALQQEIVITAHQGVATLEFSKDHYNSTGNIIDGSSGSLFDSDRPFRVTYTYNVPDSEIPKK